MRQFFSFIICLAIFCGCQDSSQIRDLQKPQDASIYAKDVSNQQSLEAIDGLKKEYLKNFFAPFVDLKPNTNIQEVFWIQSSLNKYPGYGENLKPNTLEYTQGILRDMQIENYPSVIQKAIVVKDANVRAVPTLRPRFSESSGYPFDRWQNSLIFYGTPVLITHYDVSKRFAHIQTEFVYGWVEVSDLALVNQEQIQKMLQVKNFVMPNDDRGIIYDKRGNFVTQARLGKLFMLDSQNKVLILKRTSSGHLKLETSKINLEDFHSFPQVFSQKAAAGYINALMGQRYGWGGLYESRDCSAFIRDVLANFGLYLPRNSLAQANYGDHQINLQNLNFKEKEKVILQNASPFSTLIWLKGHIMLYIGKDDENNPIVAHSGWSVQSSNFLGKKEHKLGGVVITTLKPASEFNGIFFKSKSLGDRVGKINDLLPILEGKR